MNIEKIVQEIASLCRRLKNREIQVRDMPMDAIIELIAKVYGKRVDEDAGIVALYVEMMANSIEKKDLNQLVDIIELALDHVILFSCVEQEEASLKLRAQQLQSRNAYYLNCERIREWKKRNVREPASIPFSGKGVVYSAVTGGYDRINEPQYVNPELDYILFTDDPNIRSGVWEIRAIPDADQLDNTRLARKIKILGHRYLEEYDYSIWVDGKLAITGDLHEYVEENRGEQPMLCFNHYIHDCIYQEGELCAELGKDDPLLISAQVERYKREGYPEHNGLVESAVMVRELKNSRIIQLMETWWQEIVHASKRDQLSFNYACWKNDFVYDSTALYVYGNEYVKLCGHGRTYENTFI